MTLYCLANTESVFKYRHLISQHEARIEEHIITFDNLGNYRLDRQETNSHHTVETEPLAPSWYSTVVSMLSSIAAPGSVSALAVAVTD